LTDLFASLHFVYTGSVVHLGCLPLGDARKISLLLFVAAQRLCRMTCNRLQIIAGAQGVDYVIQTMVQGICCFGCNLTT